MGNPQVTIGDQVTKSWSKGLDDLWGTPMDWKPPIHHETWRKTHRKYR